MVRLGQFSKQNFYLISSLSDLIKQTQTKSAEFELMKKENQFH